MNRQRISLRFFLIVLFLFGVSVLSEAESFLLSGRTPASECLMENNGSPDISSGRSVFLHRELISQSILTDMKQDHVLSTNGYNTFFIGGSSGRKAMNLRTFHKFSGYTTLGAALVTGLSKSSHSFHCDAAKVTTILAATTVLSGLVYYGFPVPDGSNISSHGMLHRLLGTAGMIGCAASVFLAEDDDLSSHSGLGVAGAGLMAASVVLIKW